MSPGRMAVRQSALLRRLSSLRGTDTRVLNGYSSGLLRHCVRFASSDQSEIIEIETKEGNEEVFTMKKISDASELSQVVPSLDRGGPVSDAAVTSEMSLSARRWRYLDIDINSLKHELQESHEDDNPLYDYQDKTTKLFYGIGKADLSMRTRDLQEDLKRFARFGNLPEEFENMSLVELCEKYGRVLRVAEIGDWRIVEFPTDVEAKRVESALLEYFIGDYLIDVAVVSSAELKEYFRLGEADAKRQLARPRELLALCPSIRPEEVESLFADFGSTTFCGRRLSGWDHVVFKKATDAALARKILDNANIGGQEIAVSEYVDQHVDESLAITFRIKRGESLSNVDKLLRSFDGLVFWLWNGDMKTTNEIIVVFEDSEKASKAFAVIRVSMLGDYALEPSYSTRYELKQGDSKWWSTETFIEKSAQWAEAESELRKPSENSWLGAQFGTETENVERLRSDGNGVKESGASILARNSIAIETYSHTIGDSEDQKSAATAGKSLNPLAFLDDEEESEWEGDEETELKDDEAAKLEVGEDKRNLLSGTSSTFDYFDPGGSTMGKIAELDSPEAELRDFLDAIDGEETMDDELDEKNAGSERLHDGIPELLASMNILVDSFQERKSKIKEGLTEIDHYRKGGKMYNSMKYVRSSPYNRRRFHRRS